MFLRQAVVIASKYDKVLLAVFPAPFSVIIRIVVLGNDVCKVLQMVQQATEPVPFHALLLCMISLAQ
jgi:hypothetical protein